MRRCRASPGNTQEKEAALWPPSPRSFRADRRSAAAGPARTGLEGIRERNFRLERVDAALGCFEAQVARVLPRLVGLLREAPQSRRLRARDLRADALGH